MQYCTIHQQEYFGSVCLQCQLSPTTIYKPEESLQLQQSRKEFIPSESRTEVDPRLKYLVVYDNRYQGVAMFEDQDAAIKCACDYATAGHKDVVMYIRHQPEELQIYNPALDNDQEINDPVNHPNHYTFGRFEVIDVLMDWFSDKPILWQVGKYIARAFHKGNTIEDLKKGRWYLNKQIQILEKEQVKLNG